MSNVPRFNHSPFVFGIWVPFNGRRFKDKYAIELNDGTVHNLAHPNGGGWHIDGTQLIVEDEDVKSVMLLPDGLCGRFQMEGRMRLNRNLEYCGTQYPVFVDGKFIWPDELPPHKHIRPTHVVCWHQKEYYTPEGPFRPDPILITTNGVIGTGDGADLAGAGSRITALMESIKNRPELLWGDDTRFLMSNKEVQQAMISQWRLSQYTEEVINKALDLCKENKIRPSVYLPLLSAICSGLSSDDPSLIKRQLQFIGNDKTPLTFNQSNMLDSPNDIVTPFHEFILITMEDK